MSHAGSRLLADLVDRTTLTGQLSECLVALRRLRLRHDPGRVLFDLAIAVADDAEAGKRARPQRPAGGQG